MAITDYKIEFDMQTTKILPFLARNLLFLNGEEMNATQLDYKYFFFHCTDI